jgi:Protein ChrB, N-terminal
VLDIEPNGLDRTQEEKLIARFNRERDEAYQEFIERCDGFEGEIARESAAGKFTYAELEENDEDLTKLRTWLLKIQQLDFHGASLANEAVQRLRKCEAILDSFAQRVFDAQDENRSGISSGPRS